MNVRIRHVGSLDRDEDDIVLSVSKSAKIKDLKNLIYDSLHSEQTKQKLYFGGKELVDNHHIKEYGVKNSDVILLALNNAPNSKTDKTNNDENYSLITTKSQYYKTGDLIDVVYKELGAWFEAKIIDIMAKNDGSNDEKDLMFKIVMDRDEKTAPLSVKFNEIRPRSVHFYNKSELEVGMTILANYNVVKPKERGYWYDFKITEITANSLIGTVLMEPHHENVDNCSIAFQDEVMKIEKPELLSRRKEVKDIPQRKLPLYCAKCKDVSSKNCKECSCNVCGKKNYTDQLIICNECDLTFHIFCLDPPLTAIPTEPEWYCPDCKNEDEIIKPGETLKSLNTRIKTVSENYFGPISSVEVGTNWETQTEVFDSGVHRHNGGIHYSENGIYSILLGEKNKYKVIDYGEEFYYTINTGRTSKRKIKVEFLKKYFEETNQSWILNCNINSLSGDGFGKAERWRNGKPIRVVRNYKLVPVSKYAPKHGNRYDGIYKIVEYFPEINQSSKIVFRYLLRRDDPITAPWVRENKLDVNYKKMKPEPFDIDGLIENLINQDVDNRKKWDECRKFAIEGKTRFIKKIEELFMCVCCQEIVYLPVTIKCSHVICKKCLQKCFNSEVYNCPSCRYELDKNLIMKINSNLEKALQIIYPGYKYIAFNR